MKLQNLIMIFIIIIIPIVSIFSLYLNLETKTITMQMDYDEKLIEATKEAIEAFEINTVEWNNEYSTLANLKRQDLMSSINVFINSLSDKLRIGGTSRENILTYLPAIVFTMYDGYYIYSPTYVPQTITNDNGVQLFYYENAGSEGAKITSTAIQNIEGTNVSGEPIYFAKSGEGILGKFNNEDFYFTTEVTKAEKTYKHVLKTFVPYTSNYEINGENYVINYTLDDYIRIYGEQEKEGYIIYEFGTTNIIQVSENNILGIKFNNKQIELETLIENIPVINETTGEIEVKSYSYIYNSNNDKRYYDSITGRFFTINKNYKKVYLPDTQVGTTLAEYKKILICQNSTTGSYIELYQLLNGNDNTWYYLNTNNELEKYETYQPLVDKIKDCSAINYYVDSYEFNTWLRRTYGLDLNEEEITEIINNKNKKIIEGINDNLRLSISNYSANSKINYALPVITDEDWEQALSNVSMIVFLQGQKIGLKTYNNYSVVTSSKNNEKVDEDSLYYIGKSGDNYYHIYCCNKGTPSTNQAYKNTEFKIMSYDNQGTKKYYFKHNNNLEGIYECFNCIVNRNNYTEETNSEKVKYYDKALYHALARERYILSQKTTLTDS